VKKILLILLLLTSSFVNAQNIKALATTDSLQYSVGDYIDYSIVVFAPEKYQIKMPSVKDSLKALTFLKNGKRDIVKNKNGFTTTTYNFILAGYDSLAETIPAMTLTLIDTTNKSSLKIKTNQVNVTVNTLNVDLKKDIRDVKPVISIPYNWKILVLIIVGALILLAIIMFVYKKYFKKESEEEKIVKRIVLPPHKIAYKKLGKLESEKIWQSGNIKEFHSRITEIIREYFEKRFGFNSLEMTTDETLNELRNKNIDEDVIGIVRKFLENADMVKFAKFIPMPSVNEEMMKEAYKIVDLTKNELETELTEENGNVR